jgi:hypothetical protein
MGGRDVPSAMEERIRKQSLQQMQQMDVEAMMAKMRTALDQQLQSLRKSQSKEFIERMQQEWEKQMEATRQQFEKHKQNAASPTPPIDRAREGVHQLAASADGQWLFCVGSGGLRVFSWNDVANADPTPVFFVATNPAERHMLEGNIYGLAHDDRANRLLYGGGKGLVHFLDLASGVTGVLLDPPGRPPIHALGLSRDRSALCCQCPGKEWQDSGNRVNVLQVWNYRELASKLAEPPATGDTTA